MSSAVGQATRNPAFEDTTQEPAIPDRTVHAPPQPVPVSGRFRVGIPGTVLMTATGAAAVAAAYALARFQQPGAEILFWAGQVLMVVFVAHYVFSRPEGDRSPELIVVLYGAAQFFVRWAYSPDQFRFSDELQHMRSLLNVLTTGRLFQPNRSLQISSEYPSTEILAAQLVRVGDIETFSAGTIVAGISHILLVGCLLLLFREVSGSTRIACLGALVYALNPNARFFDTSFIYEAVALPFLALTLLFAVRLARRTGPAPPNAVAGLTCSFIVATTHHLAAMAQVVLLGALGAFCLLRRGGRLAGGVLVICAAVAGMLLAGWIALAAPTTFAYLMGSAEEVLKGVTTFLAAGETSGNPVREDTPFADRILTMTGVGLTVALLPVAVWRLRRADAVTAAFAWASFGYFAVIAVRLLVDGGAELSIRALTFLSFLSSFSIAVALWGIVQWLGRVNERREVYRFAAMAVTALLLGSAITTGVPAHWERLPGTFLVASLGRGIDEQNVSAARWAAFHIPPESRFFGNVTALTLFGTYGNLDPLRNPDTLFYSTQFEYRDAETVRASQGRYVVVDLRMARDIPATGRYFPEDLEEGRHVRPIDVAALAKFDMIDGVSKIYDSGDVKVYDLRSSDYYDS